MTTSHPVPSYQSVPVLADVLAERARQDARFGRQDHPDGTGPERDNPVRLAYTIGEATDTARQITDRALSRGMVTFADILTEEAFEALAETDPARLRTELVQVAASAVCWIEAIDRRTAAALARLTAHRTDTDTDGTAAGSEADAVFAVMAEHFAAVMAELDTTAGHGDDCTGCDGPGQVPCAADEVRGGVAFRAGRPIKEVC